MASAVQYISLVIGIIVLVGVVLLVDKWDKSKYREGLSSGGATGATGTTGATGATGGCPASSPLDDALAKYMMDMANAYTSGNSLGGPSSANQPMPVTMELLGNQPGRGTVLAGNAKSTESTCLSIVPSVVQLGPSGSTKPVHYGPGVSSGTNCV